MSSGINLATLPQDHPLRNTPLGEIKATYTRAGGPAPIPAASSPFTEHKTYNELSVIWLTGVEWYTHVGDDDEWDEDRVDVIGQNGNDGLHY